MSSWGRGKVHVVNDDVEVFDIDEIHQDKDGNTKVIEIKTLKNKNRIDDDAEIGNISRLGITGRRKRFPDRVKFQATHIVPAKIGTKLWLLKSLKKLFPESSLIESDDVPYLYIAIICISFYFVFLGVGVFFGYATYMDMRTSYFLSIQGNQTLPGTMMYVQECWEVPRTLSGQYYADTNGFWSTRSMYDPAKTMYGITLTVLKITIEQFAEAMLGVIQKMKAVSARSVNRDLAWNIIMFSSYYVTIHGPISEDLNGDVIPGGTLEFYAAADSDILLGQRRIVSATFGNQFHGICDPANMNSYFDNGDKSFVFEFQLCTKGFCKPDARSDDFKYSYINACRNWYADVNTSYAGGKNWGTNSGKQYTAASPPPSPAVSLENEVFLSNKIFEPEQFGYIYGKMKQNYAELRLS
jgi:hypothetical protein